MPPLLSDGQGQPDGPHGRIGLRDLATLAGLVVLLAFLWGRARGVIFWGDEGISVGISSHSFTSIPGILRQDGSPPLYYLLLHVWMAIFGSSEAVTHILSLGFALATVPAALWAGWSLFGRRVGWTFVALMALSPFVAYYANETRMYALVVLLALLATATFAHVFVFRRRRYIPAFGVSLALLMYTHNWGLFFGVGAGSAALLCALLAEDRLSVILDAVIAFGAAALLYLPWVPILLSQVAHTGAPFSKRPTLDQVRDDVITLIGSKEATVALGLGAAMGLAVLLQRPLKRAGLTVVAIAAVPVVALALAWLVSRHDSVWQARYLAVAVAPIALVLAVGVARGGRVAVAALAVYAFMAAPIDVKQLPTQKSDVKLVSQQFGPQLQRGDLVVTDFGRVPLLSYYLPPGLRYAEAPGLVADDRRSDQRDGTARLRAADQRVTLPPLVAPLAVGGHVLVVCTPIGLLGFDDTEFVKLIFQRCDQAEKLMEQTPGLRLSDRYDPDPKLEMVHAPVQARLFTKLAPN